MLVMIIFFVDGGWCKYIVMSTFWYRLPDVQSGIEIYHNFLYQLFILLFKEYMSCVCCFCINIEKIVFLVNLSSDIWLNIIPCIKQWLLWPIWWLKQDNLLYHHPLHRFLHANPCGEPIPCGAYTLGVLILRCYSKII